MEHRWRCSQKITQEKHAHKLMPVFFGSEALWWGHITRISACSKWQHQILGMSLTECIIVHNDLSEVSQNLTTKIMGADTTFFKNLYIGNIQGSWKMDENFEKLGRNSIGKAWKLNNWWKSQKLGHIPLQKASPEVCKMGENVFIELNPTSLGKRFKKVAK
jgi:hypothetical protein